MRRVAGVVALALALGAFGASLELHERLVKTRASSSIDLLPLWLDSRAVDAGQDPTEEEVLRATYEAERPPVRVAGFHTYYPPTASLLFLPLGRASFDTAATVVRLGSALGLVVGAWLVAWAARPRSVLHGVVAALAIGAVWLGVRPTRAVLPAGQIGPAMVFATAVVLWALARGRERLAGAALALGAGIKLFPLVVLPALGRRALVAAGILLALLAVATVVFVPAFDPVAWVERLAAFVNVRAHPVWVRQEPRWVLELWRARMVGVGIVAFAGVAFAWRQRTEPRVAAATAALLAAWGGVIMAGNQLYHEGLMLLPAVGWVLAWPAADKAPRWAWGAAGGLAAMLYLFGAFDRGHPPNSLHWIPLGYATALGCAARLFHEVRAR